MNFKKIEIQQTRSKAQFWIQLGVALAIFAWVGSLGLFDDFSEPHINMWDEATYALNALDQAKGELSFQLTTEGVKDYYNTKPPLAIWFEAFSIRAFGFNTFGIRFSSILFAILTSLIVWFVTLRLSNNFIVSILAGCIFLLSPGFIHTHVARTGDLDAVVTFFITFYTGIMLLFAFEKIRTDTYVLLFSIALILAFLAKGSAGFFMIPSCIFLVFLVRPNALKSHWFWIPIFAGFTASITYYFGMAQSDPNYWEIVYKTEISRYWDEQAISWINKPFLFYFDWMRGTGFWPFSLLLPLGLIPLLLVKTHRKTILAFLSLPLVYLIFISIPSAKMHWYDAAAYPWMALYLATSIHLLYETIGAIKPQYKKPFGIVFTAICIFFLFQAQQEVQSNNKTQLTTITEMEREGAAITTLCNNNNLPTHLSIFKTMENPEFGDQLKVSIKMAEEKCDSKLHLLSKPKFKSTDFPLLVSKGPIADSLLNVSGFKVMQSIGACLIIGQ